jgi:DNA-binding NtrC family response regulator
VTTRARILLAEDRGATRERIGAILRDSGFAVIGASDGAEALARFESEGFDLVLSDHDMPRLDGLGLLRAVQRIREVPFILYSAGAEPEVVFRAGRGGALRFLPYPFRIDEQLLPTIAEALAAPAQRSASAHGAARFLGASEAARRVRTWIQRVGPTPASVLVLGETGVGKEIVARALHEESGRGRLVSFAVTELAENLLEAELFGAERGAYTGSLQTRAGLLEQAHGGTLFLDEIGDAPLALQAKLLRVLETGEVRRVGGNGARRVAIRIVSATHRDLATLVREGRFREDLFYRLAQATICVPPLRERRDDIEPLAVSFLSDIAARTGSGVPAISTAFFAALRAHAWPGNVRELRAVLESAVLWWDDSRPLAPEDLLEAFGSLRPSLDAAEQHELERMLDAYRRAGGSQEAARRALGLTRAAWRHRWRRFGLAALRGGLE